MKTFADIIAENFDEIQRNFKTGLINKGYVYDEDLMTDAFISCNTTLKDKPMSKKDAIKYYWTSYINKFKTRESSKKPISYIDDEKDPINDIDEIYNEDIDEIYNIVIKAIQDEFGLRKAFIWEMYACQGKSSKEIRSLGFDDIDNYIYFNRQIKRFIHNKLLKKNKRLKELVKYRKAL